MFRIIRLGIAVLVVAALTACGTTSAETAAPVPVEITLSDMQIDSSLNSFKADTPYEFTITNTGALPHEFMIMPAAMAGHSMTMDRMHDMALMHVSEQQLQPGTMVKQTYTFKSAGSPEFTCHLPGHYEAGMHMTVTVQ